MVMNGLYQVSNFGRIKSLEKEVNFYSGLYKEVKKRKYKERIISLRKANNGYISVSLCKDGIEKTFNVHRLVAKTFIQNPNNLPEVNHIDGNKENNCVDNLEWVTRSENMQHSLKTGLFKPKKKAVIQYDLNGNFVKRWETIKDFLIENNMNLKSSGITTCCKGRQRTAYGYIWKYDKL